MVRSRKRPFMCMAIDTTEDKEKIVVGQEGVKIVLAIDEGDARQQFTIMYAAELAPVAGNVEVVVSPFCKD